MKHNLYLIKLQKKKKKNIQSKVLFKRINMNQCAAFRIQPEA